MVTVVAQFTAKTINSEKAIYFLSLMSFSVKKLKSHMIFTCKKICVFRFYEENFFWLKKIIYFRCFLQLEISTTLRVLFARFFSRDLLKIALRSTLLEWGFRLPQYNLVFLGACLLSVSTNSFSNFEWSTFSSTVLDIKSFLKLSWENLFYSHDKRTV